VEGDADGMGHVEGFVISYLICDICDSGVARVPKAKRVCTIDGSRVIPGTAYVGLSANSAPFAHRRVSYAP
jgi:hypothetical protein